MCMGIFQEDAVNRDDVERLVDTFPGQSIDFFGALRARVYDDMVSGGWAACTTRVCGWAWASVFITRTCARWKVCLGPLANVGRMVSPDCVILRSAQSRPEQPRLRSWRVPGEGSTVAACGTMRMRRSPCREVSLDLAKPAPISSSGAQVDLRGGH